MQPIQIERWWPHLDGSAKTWLRENLRDDGIPGKIQDRIAEAGGPVMEPILEEPDWAFIEAQPQFAE